MKGVKITKWDGDEKPNIEILKKGLDDEGLDYYTFVCSSGDYFSEHTHPNYEIRIVVEGMMEYGVADEKFVLGPGDRIDMEPNIVHTAKAFGSSKIVSLAAEK
tara:strand:- start:3670 stop:3978 length:309 start_codon:yes stop_codon:yes gene_type:complete